MIHGAMAPDDAPQTRAVLSSLPGTFPNDPLEEAAIRARLSAKMFGARTKQVRIGRYTIEYRLGKGGMGVVYAARDPELDRLVALKILNDWRSDDPRQRRHMWEEARTLARLSHPNIVQIFEVGEHEGAIFLALEYIEGEPLSSWQLEPTRGWREICDVYLAAARGLVAAHQVDVIHRDIKPANILVGKDGRVRVADFGLARERPEVETITHGSLESGRTHSSRLGAGTPAYMSPEQIRFETVDARSDVFSLCVSMFEGLYGRRPFTQSQLKMVDRDKRISLKALRNQTPRDTDVPTWVLRELTAGLQFNRALRTQSVDALISGFERASRRRRFAWISSVVALGLTLVAGVLWTVVQDDPCPDWRENIPGVWDGEIKQNIAGIFDASPLPYAEQVWLLTEATLDETASSLGKVRAEACEQAMVERTRSIEMYDRISECLRQQRNAMDDLIREFRRGDPSTQTRAYELARELGRPEDCTDEQILREGLFPPPPPEKRARAEELKRLLDRAGFLITTGQYKQAQIELTQIASQVVSHPRIEAEFLYVQGRLARLLDQPEKALDLLLRAGRVGEGSAADRVLVANYRELVELATSSRREPAQAWGYLGFYEGKLRRIDASNRQWADYYDRKGRLELLIDHPKQAQQAHEEALRRRPADDYLGRAHTLKDLANAYAELGELDSSITMLEQAKAMLHERLGENHPDTAIADFDLALSLQERALSGTKPDTDELDTAEQLMRHALEIETATNGFESIGAAQVRLGLANLLVDSGKYNPKVLRECEQVVEIFTGRFGLNHDDSVNALALTFNLYYYEDNDLKSALATVEKLIQAHEALADPVDFDYLLNAGEISLQLQRFPEAKQWFERALVRMKQDPPDRMREAYVHNGLGHVYIQTGDTDEARVNYARAQAALADVPVSQEGSELLRAEVWWGRARSLGTGERTQAKELANRALKVFRSHTNERSYRDLIVEVEAFTARR